MRSALSDAGARCHVRRLRGTVAAAPLPAAIASSLVVVAPFALVRVGGAVGAELSALEGTGSVADALLLGPALAAAAAGAALAMSFPGRSALGQQLAAGPCSRRGAVGALLLVPALVLGLAVLPSLLAACVALAREWPGGALAGVALAVATGAAVPAGAVAAEGALAAIRGQRRRPLAIVAGALAWTGIGAALGAAPLGPLAVVPAALRGTVSPWPALAISGGMAAALALAWVALAATRPEPRPRAAGSARRLARGGRLRLPTALAALLVRRSDIRLATAGALGFGVFGIATAAAVAAAPAPAPFLLGTTTALLGSIVWALAVCGVVLAGRWLWLGAPCERRSVVLAAGLAGLAGSAVPVAIVGAGATVASGATWRAVGVVAAFVLVGSAAALLAGALVPWSGTGMGEQMTTFAALAAIAITVSLAVALGAPRLVALGVPDILVVALVCAASMAAAFHGLGRRLGAAA